MKKEYAEFLELFHPQPGYKVLEVTTHADSLTELLADFMVPYDGRLALAMYPGEHREFAASEYLKPHAVPDFSKPFRALPRDNDIVVLDEDSNVVLTVVGGRIVHEKQILIKRKINFLEVSGKKVMVI